MMLKHQSNYRYLLLFLSFLLFLGIFSDVSMAQEEYNVVFDETRPYKTESLISETAGYGASIFADSLQDNGFNVSRISEEPLSYEKLQGYDVLVVMSSVDTYSDNEINAIEEFVRNGGGLLLAVQSWEGVNNQGPNRIAKRFGVSFSDNAVICDSENYYEIFSTKDRVNILDLTSHSITKNVSSFYLQRGTSIIVTGDSHVLANASSNAWLDDFSEVWDVKESTEITGPFPVLSEMTYGNGRIVFIGSKRVFNNDWVYLNQDNGQLGINSVHWLAKLSNTSSFIPLATRDARPSNFLYRVAGFILSTLILLMGLIFVIRMVEKQNKPVTIKPVENWKVSALIIGHIFILILSLFWLLISFVDLTLPAYEIDYNPYYNFSLFFALAIFTFTTSIIIKNLLSKIKLHEKYLYINIFICIYIISNAFFFGDQNSITYYFYEILFRDFISQTVPFFIINFISLIVTKKYGRELVLKEKEYKILQKSQSKILPSELNKYYSGVVYIGEGGFASVYRAKRKKGGEIALKIPKSFNQKAGKDFIKEVSNWSNLEHENIVGLYDYNIYPTPYFEMELCDGCLEHEDVIIDRAVSIVYDVAKGLRYSHGKKVIHGDIKLSNILMVNGKAKISDWGLSKMKLERSVSMSGLTPSYAAPEQISSKFGKADERTDIYQLGVVFYELVTGELPFSGNPSKIYESIIQEEPEFQFELDTDSKCIKHIIMKCLEKIKEDRYQNIDEFLKELKACKPEDENTISYDEEQKTVEFKKD